ncbi:APC family permease [Pseudomonas sp. NPDC087342]|uniref:APC family permease n=1 Tax=Pseudomonas sp. NPDC087342 TaxID=3364437 RepID=UPI003825CEE5
MAQIQGTMDSTLLGDIGASHVLPRRLGTFGLVMLIVAFNSPVATVAGFMQLSIGFGNGLGAPVSFLLAGLLLLVFSVGFIGMSQHVDNPGAFYKFIVIGVGREPGLSGAFLATCAYLLIGAGSYPYMGLVAVDFVKHLTGESIFSWHEWALIFMAICTVLGLLRIDISVKALGALVIVECVLVAAWEIAVFFQGGPEGYQTTSFTYPAFISNSPGLGVLFAMLCMVGIEAGACFSAETRNPERSVKRATYIAIVFLAAFYSIGSWAYIISEGGSGVIQAAISNPVGSFFASVERSLGKFVLTVFSLTVVTSQMIAINAIQGSASRYLFSLGKSRILPKQLSLVHARLESPWVAVLLVTAFGFTVLEFIAWFKLDPVAAYGGITGMGIYFLLPLLIATSFSIIVFYRKNIHINAGIVTRLVAPALSVIALSVLFVLTSLNLNILVGTKTMVVTSMILVFAVASIGWLLAVYFRKFKPVIFAKIGSEDV